MGSVASMMESPFLATGFIILLPLLPAACIYWLLTSEAERKSKYRNQNAAGNAKATIGPTVFGITFNIVGSTAVYIVVLIFAFSIFFVVNNQRQQAFSDNTPWLVELPIGAVTRDPTDPTKPKPVVMDMVTQNQLQIELQPNYQILGGSIMFWVMSENQKFPRIRIVLPNVSATPFLDLNDVDMVTQYPSLHRLTGIGKQWIRLQAPYDASSAATPKLIGTTSP